MPDAPFVHLHCHTHYSLLDGANRIPELVAHVKEQGMNAVAMTDHGNLYGAVEFYKEARAAGVNPIIGYEAYVAPNKRVDRETKRRGEAEKWLRLRFKRAQEEGEIKDDADPAGLARFYAAVMQGMSVQAASGASRKALQSIISHAMTVWPEAAPAKQKRTKTK